MSAAPRAGPSGGLNSVPWAHRECTDDRLQRHPPQIPRRSRSRRRRRAAQQLRHAEPVRHRRKVRRPGDPAVQPLLPAGQDGHEGDRRRIRQARGRESTAQHRRLGDLPYPAADLPHLGHPAGRLHLVPRIGRRVVREEGPPPRHQRHLGEAGTRRVLRRAEEAVHLRLQRQEGLRTHQLLLVGHVLPEVQLRQVGRAGAQVLGRVPRPVRQAQEQGRRPDRPRRRRRHPVGGLRMVRLPQHSRQRRDVPPRTPRGQAPLRRPRGPQGLRPLGRGTPLLRPQRHGDPLPGRHHRAAPGSYGHDADRHLLRRRRAQGRPRRPGLLPVPRHRPQDTGGRGGPHRRLLRQCPHQAHRRRQGTDALPGHRRGTGDLPQELLGHHVADPPRRQGQRHPLVLKGRKLIESAADLTQFFNRDSSDALQPTADTALVHYLAKPKQVGSILTTWQRSAQKIWSQ